MNLLVAHIKNFEVQSVREFRSYTALSLYVHHANMLTVKIRIPRKRVQFYPAQKHTYVTLHVTLHIYSRRKIEEKNEDSRMKT